MTHRYIALPEGKTTNAPRASYYDGDVGDLIHMDSSCTVMVEDKSPEFTGLRDANGHRLYRVPDTVKLGFHTK